MIPEYEPIDTIENHVPPVSERGFKSAAIDFLAGSLGGVAGVVSGHPFDTIKVRLQSQLPGGHTGGDKGGKRYRGTLHALKVILKEEKVRGLYKGMTSPLFGVAVINSLLFGVYGWFIHTLSRGSPDPTISNIFWAGCGSGFVNSFFSCPMELVKIRLQNQKDGKKMYKGPLDCCRCIWRTEGPRGFFRGFGATVWRETPSYGVYFASYEVFAHLLTPPGAAMDVPSPGLLMAGGLAGIVGWLSTYPIDVAKTRIQSQTSGRSSTLFQTIRTIYQREGIKVLFAGLGATALRAFPTNAATFYVVTAVKNGLDPKEKARVRKEG
ncbi:hypothetical protein HDV05_008429 [Chytridiales sp. JEL 0842]|nr:hypothetical protein HDV05_008429 [Chytridiales sp. JEL 0842]